MVQQSVAESGAGQGIADALGLIMRLRSTSDSELGRRIGFTTQRVQARRVGITHILADELPIFAAAMGVPTQLFTMNAAEILEWFSQHPDLAVDGCAARDSNPEPADYGAYQPTLALFSAGLAA